MTSIPADIDAAAIALVDTYHSDDVSLRALVSRALLAERNRAYEECAGIIDAGQETTSNTKDGTEHTLTPRKHGNLAGLAYAAAIRALLK